ncbi:hypothetical protein ACWDX6_28730 [Streptomyces sp. NPDC003027]
MYRYRTAVVAASALTALSLALGASATTSVAAPGDPGPSRAATCGGDRDDYVGLTFRGSITNPRTNRKLYDLEATFWHQPTQPYLVDLKMTNAFHGTLTTAQNSYSTSNVQWWNVTFRTPDRTGPHGESYRPYTVHLKAACDDGGTKPTSLEGRTGGGARVQLTRV